MDDETTASPPTHASSLARLRRLNACRVEVEQSWLSLAAKSTQIHTSKKEEEKKRLAFRSFCDVTMLRRVGLGIYLFLFLFNSFFSLAPLFLLQKKIATRTLLKKSWALQIGECVRVAAILYPVPSSFISERPSSIHSRGGTEHLFFALIPYRCSSDATTLRLA